MYYMETKIKLPDNDAALARIANITPEKWADMAALIRAFFIPMDNKLHHNKCEAVLAKQGSSMRVNVKRAKKAARARWDYELERKGQIPLSENGSCSEHEPSTGQACSVHAIKDKKTEHERTGEKDSIPPKPDLSLKTPLPPRHEFGTNAPNLTGAGTGFKSVGEAGGIGGEKARPRFHLGTWLDANPDARHRIMKELLDVCPGHDRNFLLAEYDRTADKRDGTPSNPERAFIGWAKKIYGKK
jgi:uncharacterized protein YdaU (DUF1376 family)